MREYEDGAELLESVARELRAPVVMEPTLDARVMAVVGASPYRRRAASPLEWLLRPRTVRLAPLTAFALAAGVAAVALVGGAVIRTAVSGGAASFRAEAPATARLVSDGDAQPRSVQFVLVAPGAARVTLVGEFNDWDEQATPLRRLSGDGLWSVSLPLQPGRYLYMFVVDGTRWVADPDAPPALEDDFGVQNSVVTVTGPAT